MERHIELNPKLVKDCCKIILMLPKKDGDIEFMTIKKGEHGFNSLIRRVEAVATKIKEQEKAEEERKNEQDGEDYAKYLELKAKFEVDKPF